MNHRSTAVALLIALAGAAQAATPTHLYLLNNGSDALGGPALTGLGGTFGTSAYGQVGYSFGANQGLSVSGAVGASVYTIDFSVALDNVLGYRRLVDFQDLGSDTGLYVLNQTLDFYPVANGSPVLNAGELARITVTRDAAGVFTGYVNGVQQLQFTDSNGWSAFSGPSQVAYFFRDDNAVANEASSGFVDYIRIYDVALSASEVAALANPVPEPATWASMAAGLAAVGSIVARRRRVAPGRHGPA